MQLVEAEDTRHGIAVAQLGEGVASGSQAEAGLVPAVVRLAAEVVQTPLSVDGHVELGPALRLPGGTAVRWLGTFDLLRLARLMADPTPRVLVLAGLQEAGLDPGTARAVLDWAVRNGMVADADGTSA